MPKVSPLRKLIGSSPKSLGYRNGDREQLLLDDEHSSSARPAQETRPKADAMTPRGKKGSFAAVYPHSENVPENLITPEKKTNGKFSWYQRQVKNLGTDGENSRQAIPRNPHHSAQKSSTPRVGRIDREPLQSHSATGSSSNVQEAHATPRKNISRSLKYSQAVPAAAGGSQGSENGTQQQQQQNAKAISCVQIQPMNTPHFELEEDSSFWLEHNVQVLLRIRPLSNDEISVQGYDRCIRQEGAHSLTWIGNPDTRFTFDHVACEAVTQEKLFKVAGVPLVENCMGGYNGCIFAYGQTGSGKTHTMLGDIYQKQSENRGVTPRVFEHLFVRIHMEEEARRHEKLKYTCKCSFLEIYNEQITDLLEPSSTNLQVREDAKRGVYVESLTEVEVNSVEDVITLLLQGASNRKVAATNMNRESSRSHSVLTCVIESKWERAAVINRRFGRLNLVDLAGSERQKASGAENERLKEAANINKSLSTLGLVIMILVDVANGKQRHVPYRDSKLTYLLQDSLGGNSKTMIIATVSPSMSCSMDTLSTLKFAQRAKFICNNAVVNGDTSGNVTALRQQIHKLQEEVNHLRSLNSETSSSAEEYDGEMAIPQTRRKRKDNISKLLSAEFQKLNQLRESLEAELEIGPFHNDSYQAKLQDCQTENEKLHRQIDELQKTLNTPLKVNEDRQQEMQLRGKIEYLELDQEEHLKTISNLEALLQKGEESKAVQAAFIRSLELHSRESSNEIQELKSQVKEAKDVQEQMESQQLFLINEFETLLEERNKMSESLKKTEAREQKLKDHLRLLNWELKKKEELHDLEKELETRASAESLTGFVDEEEKFVLEAKLRKTRKELEEARRRNLIFQGEQASRIALEKQMDITRSEVEAETANAIACMNREMMVAKEECAVANERATRLMEDLEDLKLECKSLIDENSRLTAAYDSIVHEKDMEVQELRKQYEDATSKLIDFLAEGDQALAAAAKEMEEIIEESFLEYTINRKQDGGRCKSTNEKQELEVLQKKLYQAFHIAKDAEGKVKALSAMSEQQKNEIDLENVANASEIECLKAKIEDSHRQLREEEKKAYVAFMVVRHLEGKLKLRTGTKASAEDAAVSLAHEKSHDEHDWKAEKEELLLELTEAKLETAAKARETAAVLQKFKDSQNMLREAEQLLNALVKANESAKCGAQGWKDEMRTVALSTVTCFPERDYMKAKLEKAKDDLAIMKNEIGSFKFDTVYAMTDAEQEVQSTMQSIEQNLKDIMSFVFSFGDGIRDEFVELRDTMYEMMGEADSLLGEIRRKNELLKGLEYDISLLQEAFSEAHEKKIELQEANEKMQEELESKTSEINGAETELLQLLKTLTTVESELRTLKSTTSYLSTENKTQRQKIEELESKNIQLEQEVDDKKHLVQSLDSELLELSFLVERKILHSPEMGDQELNVVVQERNELHAELIKVREELENARAVSDDLELVAAKSRKIAEECQALSDEKEEEVKVLEKSVQELECTITTMENQVGLIKREAEMQRLMKEDLEMEVHKLRAELSRTKTSVQAFDGAEISVDKIKLLRLEEEVENLREECLRKDAQISALRKHISELMNTYTKEASEHRKKIKEFEALHEARSVPAASQKAADKSIAKAKGSGSPFKCIGLGVNSEELSTNRRRVEELEAMASAREKEVFMLSAKLAQAESMTYDVVRDLLGIKHDITSYVRLNQQQRG